MKRFVLVAAWLAAAAGLVPGADPFPQPQPVPAPMPQPAPVGSVLNLTTDALYVVNSPAEAVLRVHPRGLVKVTKETGPLSLRGKFADGNGAVETRKYSGPCLYIVEALPGKSGQVELDLIPVAGVKDEAGIATATIDVNGGAAPVPPPKPVEPPKPDPVPSPVATGAWVIVVQDETVAAPASLTGPTMAKLQADGRGHIYGTKTDAAKIAAKKYDALLTEARVKGSGLIVLDKTAAKVVVVPLPTTDADLAAALKGLVPGL